MAKKNMVESVAIRMAVNEILKLKPNWKIYLSSTSIVNSLVEVSQDKNLEVLEYERVKFFIQKTCEDLYLKLFFELKSSEEYKSVDIMSPTASLVGKIWGALCIKDSSLISGLVKDFAFPGDPCYTFCRIPFPYYAECREPEIWQNFMDNFTNAAAVRLWVGSLFDMNSNRSQYLWIYGKGGNGKTTLAKIISSVLKGFVKFDNVPKKDCSFWTHGLIGKRLIVIDDCNQYGFVKSGTFKSITGGGRVRVEQKYCTPYDTDLNCKFLFTSNELPLISADSSDQRRIILSTSKNNKEFAFNPEFEENLEKALPEFISYCINQYKSSVHPKQPIPTDSSEALELAHDFDEDIAAWVLTIGTFNDPSVTAISEINNAISMKSRFNKRDVWNYLKKNGVIKDDKFVNVKFGRYVKGFEINRHLRLIKDANITRIESILG